MVRRSCRRKFRFTFAEKAISDSCFLELAKLRNLPKDVVAWEIRVDDASPGRTREKWSLTRVLSTPRVRLPLLLVLALQAGQQLAGINAVSTGIYSK